MNHRHIWIVEIQDQPQGPWKATDMAAPTRKDGTERMRLLKQEYEEAQFRLRKYVPA